MAQTLLAILFATSSASDHTIAFRWPASPRAFPRLARPRPPSKLGFEHLDASYRAAAYSGVPSDILQQFSYTDIVGDGVEYEWQRPTVKRYRSQSLTSSGRSSSGGRRSPVNQRGDHGALHPNGEISEYDTALGYNVDVLAQLLCPRIDNCHQKFELIVDDLAFIGHPACVDERGKWSFTWATMPPDTNSTDDSSEGTKDSTSIKVDTNTTTRSMLQLFHVVFVLDLPDPSSSASGNLNKYFDSIYQTVAFPLTAVLFNEQVLHKYVEREWDLLFKLREDCISNGISYDDYVAQCLVHSSLARALERTYTSIRTNSLARLTLYNISLVLQLPPFLDLLLRADPSDPSGSSSLGRSGIGSYEDDEDRRGDDDYIDWGPELSFGWKLPALTPWKSLLLLDIDPEAEDHKADPLQNLNRPGLTKDERVIAEGLSRFLDNASIFVSLSDLAALLDWDLHKQVFPTVKYLVQRRRAKVVDLVRSSLKNIFTLPPRIATPMVELTADFAKAFPSLPPLALIFSWLSSSPNNFFESVVKNKDNITIYQNVVIWLLKRDLLVMLHMRFRLIAIPTLKQLVAATRRERRKARERQHAYQQLTLRGRRRKSSAETHSGSPSLSRSRSLLRSVLLPEHDEALADESGEDGPFSPISASSAHVSPDIAKQLSLRSPTSIDDYAPRGSPVALTTEHRQTRRRFSDTSSLMQRAKLRRHRDRKRDSEENGDSGEVESESESDPDDPDDLEAPSLISTPERATPKERRWLRAMAMGKDPAIAKRFELIQKYFDGKKTVEEILYKADMSRKQLREVLHHFSDNITPFLHP